MDITKIRLITGDGYDVEVEVLKAIGAHLVETRFEDVARATFPDGTEQIVLVDTRVERRVLDVQFLIGEVTFIKESDGPATETLA
jgi:hypothetical protein